FLHFGLFFVSFWPGTAHCSSHQKPLRLLAHRKEFLLFILVVELNSDVCARLFSAADRCFPRARLQPPRANHSAGSSDTCCSRRSQRSFAPNNHHKSRFNRVINKSDEVEKHKTSEGNTRRLLRD